MRGHVSVLIRKDYLGVGGVSAKNLLGWGYILDFLEILVIVGEIPEHWLVLDERSDGTFIHDSYNLNKNRSEEGLLSFNIIIIRTVMKRQLCKFKENCKNFKAGEECKFSHDKCKFGENCKDISSCLFYHESSGQSTFNKRDNN